MADNAATLESMLEKGSAPIHRSRAQYFVLSIGITITLALMLVLLLVVLPLAASAVAWLIEVAPRLTNGM